MKGYRYFILVPNREEYEPHEKTFKAFKECYLDAREHGYSYKEIGIDYCEEDKDGWITVIERVKAPFKAVFEK